MTFVSKDGGDVPLRYGQYDSPGGPGFETRHIEGGHGSVPLAASIEHVLATSLALHEDRGSVWVEVLLALTGRFSGAHARQAMTVYSPEAEVDPNPNLRGAIFATSVVERLDRLYADKALALAADDLIELPAVTAQRSQLGRSVES